MPLLVRLPNPDDGGSPQFLNVLDRKKTAVQRALRRGGLGGYEPEFLSSILALWEAQKRGFVFYDVGAHIGVYSALAAKLFGANCHAFEPTPETFNDCRNLMQSNRLAYSVTQVAVSDEAAGEIDLFISPKAETSNSLNGGFRVGSVPVKARTLSLDSYIENGAPDPAIVKIDVETHEPAVIIGGLKMIARAKPILACEFLPSVDVVRLAAALESLDQLGYKFFHMLRETPWEAKNIRDATCNLRSSERDWLLVAGEFPENFYQRRDAWKTALSKCGADTNLLVPAKNSK
jgi:FkbM family methyltransferase